MDKTEQITLLLSDSSVYRREDISDMPSNLLENHNRQVRGGADQSKRTRLWRGDAGDALNVRASHEPMKRSKVINLYLSRVTRH